MKERDEEMEEMDRAWEKFNALGRMLKQMDERPEMAMEIADAMERVYYQDEADAERLAADLEAGEKPVPEPAPETRKPRMRL